MNTNEENNGLAGAGNMDDTLNPKGYIAVLKPPHEQPKEFSEPHPEGFEYAWAGYTKLEPTDYPTSEPVDSNILLGADDNAILFVASGYAILGPRGPQWGGNYEEITSEPFPMKPGDYYPASLWYENIHYKPANQNVAILKTRLNGNPITLYNLVPEDQVPEKEPCACPCSCENGNEGGQPAAAAPAVATLAAASATSFVASPLASSSAGNRTTATSDEDAMIWRINFGVLRGLMGIPGGHLELVRFTGGSENWSPAALDYRHPLEDKLDIPQGGIVENGMVRIRAGSGRRYYLITKSGPAPMGITTLRGERTTLLTAQKTPTVDIASAAYMRVEQNDKSCADYNIATGRLDSYTTPLQQTFTAAELAAHLAVIRDGAGYLRQIRNTWDGLLNIENVTATGYTIALYLPGQITGQDVATGLYTTEGAPFKTYTISGDPETGRLAITERAADRTPHTTAWWQQNRVWNMIQGSGEAAAHTLRERIDHEDGTWTIVTRVRTGAEGTDASCTAETWRNSPYGPQRLSRTEGHGSTAALTTRYTWNGSGRLTGETAPDGSATTYGYAAGSRIRSVSTPWAGGGERIVYTYYRDERGNSDDIAYTRTALIKNNEPTHLDRTDYAYIEANHIRRVEKRITALGSPHTRLETTETWLGTAPNALDRGRTRMTQAIDGAQTWYAYAATAEHGAIYTVTAETRIEGAPVAGQSTRSIRYIDAAGNTVRTEQHALTLDGQWRLLDSADYAFDHNNKWTRRTRANGRTAERENMCCGLLWEKDENGITTAYAYDSLRRNTETIRSATETTPETIVSRSYDALGRTVAVRTDIGAMTTVETTAYDAPGRLASQTDALGRTTAYAYSADGLTETVTTPAGATLATRRHPDGTVLEQSGSGQRHLLHIIDTVDDGIRTATRTSAAEGSLLLLRTVVNGFGDTIRVATPNAVGGSNYANSSYNAKGQLIRQQTDALAPLLYDYDAMGNLIRQTVALSDAPTPADSRISEQTLTYEQRENGTYQTATRTDYNAEGQPVTTEEATLASSLDATLAAQTVATDARGNATVRWTLYGEGPALEHRLHTPESDTEAVTTVIDGYAIRETDHRGVTTTRSRSYTAAGSVETVTDGRGNATLIERDIAGRTVKQTDAAGHATLTAYDPATGQPSLVTDALGHTVRYAYDHRGRKTSENGTAIQPVRYTYDSSDRLATMETWRYPGKNLTEIDPTLTGDITRWDYAADTGLLTRKTYADGSRTDYAYDSNNRLSVTTQSRGTRSTWTYAPLTGEPIALAHSDGTPGETYTYNHLGQLLTASDAAGARTYAYNRYGELETEQTEGLVSSLLTRTRDGLGRSSGHTLAHAGSLIQHIETAYDNKGRIGSAGDHGKTPYTWGYAAASGLLETLQYPNTLKRWYLYEPKRNLVATINYQRPGSANYPAKTDYAYDALGRPTGKQDYWNTATPGRTHAYAYNSRSELEADNIQPGGNRSYTYDNIGNRKNTVDPARNLQYASTPLNQYGAIGSFTPQYDADGNQTKIKTATGEWTVTYNANNRPVEFVQGTKRIACIYDHMGRRVEKAAWNNNTLTKRQRYIYNGYVQIAEIDATNEDAPQVAKTYLWDPSEPVATRVLHMTVWNNGTETESLYYTHDLQKNVTALFGQAAGRRAQYEHDPYGNPINTTGDAAGINPYRYSSEYLDEDLGLIYYNYRHYNPTDGRWINRDPIAEQGGINLYGFVENRPIAENDLLGWQYAENTIDLLSGELIPQINHSEFLKPALENPYCYNALVIIYGEIYYNPSATYVSEPLGAAIDADGAWKAYHPNDKLGLDYKGNGKSSIQGIQRKGIDPCPGFYVSATSAYDPHIKNVKSPYRYIQSDKQPYIVMPGTKKDKRTGRIITQSPAKIGDFATVIRVEQGHIRIAHAIIADVGPRFGEMSIKTAAMLGIGEIDRKTGNKLPPDPKNGGVDAKEFIYIVYPNTNPKQCPGCLPITNETIQRTGEMLFQKLLESKK